MPSRRDHLRVARYRSANFIWQRIRTATGLPSLWPGLKVHCLHRGHCLLVEAVLGVEGLLTRTVADGAVGADDRLENDRAFDSGLHRGGV